QTTVLEAHKISILGCDVLKSAVERLAQSRSVPANLFDGRPIFWQITRQAAVDRIDAKSEKLVKFRIERRKPKRFPEEIPVERFEMANIENNPVALGYWSVVECCGLHNFK